MTTACESQPYRLSRSGVQVPKTNDSGTWFSNLESDDVIGEKRSRTRANIHGPQHHHARSFGILSHRHTLVTMAQKLALNHTYTDTSTA